MNGHVRETLEGFDLYVEKFQCVCDMHGVRHQSPADFSDFMKKLAEDRHFGMDFWALTGSLSSREGGQLSDEQMYNIIVESVAGGAIAETDADLRKSLADLSSLLAGVDVQRPPEENDPPPTARRRQKGPREKPVKVPKFAGKPISQAPPIPPAANGATGNGSVDVESGVSLPSAVALQAQLDEALLRLELKSLELERHLDNIDNRMNRLEPHVEELTSKVSAAPLASPPQEQPVQKAAAAPISQAIEELARRRAEISSFSPAPDASRSAEPLAPAQAPLLPIPLEDNAPHDGHGSLILLLIFVLIAIAGIVVQQRYGSPKRDRGNQSLQNGSAVETGQPDSRDSSSAPNAADRADAVPTRPSARTGTATFTEPKVPDAKYDLDARRKTKAGRSASAESTDDIVAADEEGPVIVSPVVMARNLVISRVPAYPQVAKDDHIEGPVVVQAIISKSGNVDSVHVVEGDKLLRSAAAEAVQKWRYRPYLVNGQPVDVATTITVDFKLNR